MSVGRPAAEDGHATGVVLIGFNVALIGYDIAFSLSMVVQSSSAMRGPMGGEVWVQSIKAQRKRNGDGHTVPCSEGCMR